MSGYREHGFDPNAWEPQGPPLKPYNWVQWTGVAFSVLGILALLAYCAEKLGLIPDWIANPAPIIMLGGVGTMLVNSRREPIPEAEQPEYRRKLRRNTVIGLIVAAIAAVVGFTAAFYFQGAN